MPTYIVATETSKGFEYKHFANKDEAKAYADKHYADLRKNEKYGGALVYGCEIYERI